MTTLGCLDHSRVPVLSLRIKFNPLLRRTECRVWTDSVMCHAILQSHHPCLLLLWAVCTDVYVYIYNLLGGWLIKCIGFHSTTFVGIISDWICCWRDWMKKYWHVSVLHLTFLVLLLVVWFHVISLSARDSTQKMLSAAQFWRGASLLGISFTSCMELGRKPWPTVVQTAGDTRCTENSCRGNLEIVSRRDLFLKRMAPFNLILISKVSLWFKAGFLSNDNGHHIYQSLRNPCKVTFDPNIPEALTESPSEIYIHWREVHVFALVVIYMHTHITPKQGFVGRNKQGTFILLGCKGPTFVHIQI